MPENLSPSPKLDPIGIRPTAFEAETIVPALMAFFGEDRTAVTRRAWFFLWQAYCKEDVNMARIRELYETPRNPASWQVCESCGLIHDPKLTPCAAGDAGPEAAR